MQVFLFNSQCEPRAFGFTADCRGANLTGSLAPWHPLGVRPMSGGGDVCGTDRAASVLTSVSKIGYYVALASVAPDADHED